ncbi:unnamed protein product [Zymoseptoria tritici ST99CH_3D7]|uniref:Uncharacterized protein n=1 Tax=Zymoseptoria tritici (strain ST99CH_3D7) TaxID=1276538 RepID=A0A1X7SAB1_ZYMT9|nr:unnamed protein product [Zymoseptoria tritici ST99CH_3D7]
MDPYIARTDAHDHGQPNVPTIEDEVQPHVPVLEDDVLMAGNEAQEEEAQQEQGEVVPGTEMAMPGTDNAQDDILMADNGVRQEEEQREQGEVMPRAELPIPAEGEQDAAAVENQAEAPVADHADHDMTADEPNGTPGKAQEPAQEHPEGAHDAAYEEQGEAMTGVVHDTSGDANPREDLLDFDEDSDMGDAVEWNFSPPVPARTISDIVRTYIDGNTPEITMSVKPITFDGDELIFLNTSAAGGLRDLVNEIYDMAHGVHKSKSHGNVDSTQWDNLDLQEVVESGIFNYEPAADVDDEIARVEKLVQEGRANRSKKYMAQSYFAGHIQKAKNEHFLRKDEPQEASQ